MYKFASTVCTRYDELNIKLLPAFTELVTVSCQLFIFQSRETESAITARKFPLFSFKLSRIPHSRNVGNHFSRKY